MDEIEILKEISNIKIENIMKHEQFADIMDFMGLRGFKRIGEYYFLLETYEYRKLHRFAINHFNEIIFDNKVETPNLIPSSWENHERYDVDDGTRKRYTKQMFIEWLDWEKKTMKNLSSLYKESENVSCYLADYILCMIKDNAYEIKYLERQLIEYESVEWNMVYIMSKQDELHDCYKEKTNDLSI